jgi:hypothetical protein
MSLLKKLFAPNKTPSKPQGAGQSTGFEEDALARELAAAQAAYEAAAQEAATKFGKCALQAFGLLLG